MTITAAQLAAATGTTEDGAAERVLPVAVRMVLDYAPAAPTEMLNEAVVRFGGYLLASDFGGVRTETLGPMSVEYQLNHAAAFRNSGAALLLTRYKVRRGRSCRLMGLFRRSEPEVETREAQPFTDAVVAAIVRCRWGSHPRRSWCHRRTGMRGRALRPRVRGGCRLACVRGPGGHPEGAGPDRPGLDPQRRKRASHRRGDGHGHAAALWIVGCKRRLARELLVVSGRHVRTVRQ